MNQTLPSQQINSLKQQARQKLPHKNKDLQRNQNGSMIMNERNLKIICENEGLYEYPYMNNKIYLHFKVIQKIQNLDKYLNLKTIYLQNNVISKIQNLDCLTKLQNLFLHNNMIKKIQNLQNLKQLRVINLNNNNIFKIEGLSQLPHLQNLNLATNYITQYDDLEHLGHCTTELTAIDLSNNHIKPNIQMLNLIPQVKCLYLSGNPLVRETKHYRRVIVGTLKNLLYLDQRGIDQEQRMLSQAWVEGGEKAFKQTKQKVNLFRQKAKQQKKQQIMKDIDVHRNRKINIFLNNIKQFQQEIQKTRGYMNQKGNQDMIYFYEQKIAQLYQKIRQNQQFVNNINKRIGASAKSISSGESQKNINQSDKSICSQESQGKIFNKSDIDNQQAYQNQINNQKELNEQVLNQISDQSTQLVISENYNQIQQLDQKQNLLISTDKNQQIKMTKQQLSRLQPMKTSGLNELD